MLSTSLVLAALLVSSLAEAHELPTGLLRARATGAEAWRVTWRPPAGAGLQPALPEVCAPRVVAEGRVWVLACSQEDLRFEWPGLAASGAEVLVSVEPLAGEPVVRRAGAAPEVTRAPPAWTAYLGLGVEHILLGFDHLAFVFGLLLIVRGMRRRVAMLTAFTFAHSLTLAGAALGWVHVPGPPLEACIALSVVFVARAAASPAGSERAAYPWAFGFGLLHGLGFAGALAELGLPAERTVAALLAFNVGVELGQVLVVAALAAAAAALAKLAPRAPARLRTPAAYGLGVTAALWTVQRVAMVGGWQ